MRLTRAQEQSIAVFGESGSGKTVLLSSFYGTTQEPGYADRQGFRIVADDAGQGHRLNGNFVGMKNSARVPIQTILQSTTYSFTMKFDPTSAPRAASARAFDALRLNWHDYPGEWFTEEPGTPEECQERDSGFRSLLGSDVAFILVDAQMLLENSGHEERYLRSLISNAIGTLVRRREDIMPGGKRLLQFPRIWMLALSKSDLMPDFDVYEFRDLIEEKASGEIAELRTVLESIVDGKEALSVGEDFVLLSSAKFDNGSIDVNDRVGVDLILPLAAMLPVQRHLEWSQRADVSRHVAQHLREHATPLAVAILGGASWLANRLPGRARPVGELIARVLPLVPVDRLLHGLATRLDEIGASARRRGDGLQAALAAFGGQLDEAERQSVLLRSRR